MSLVLQRETTEYIYIGVDGDTVDGDAELAFLDAEQRPDTADWTSAIKVEDDQHELWEDAQSSGVGGDWFIARLVGDFGAGGLVLEPGDYQPWVRLTDETERPVRLAPVTLEIA